MSRGKKTGISTKRHAHGLPTVLKSDQYINARRRVCNIGLPIRAVNTTLDQEVYMNKTHVRKVDSIVDQDNNILGDITSYNGYFPHFDGDGTAMGQVPMPENFADILVESFNHPELSELHQVKSIVFPIREVYNDSADSLVVDSNNTVLFDLPMHDCDREKLDQKNQVIIAEGLPSAPDGFKDFLDQWLDEVNS